MSNGFTFQLEDSGQYLMNPTTGEILDTGTGQVYPDVYTFEMASTTGMEGGVESPSVGQQVIQGALPIAGAMGMSGMAMPSLGSAATVAGSSALLPAGASFATSSAPVGTAVGGGTVLANGTVVPAGGAAAGGLGTVALTGAGIGAGAATGFLQGQGVYDFARGRNMSLPSQVALALPTFGASFLANPITRMFGSGKNKGQKERDSVRSNLRSNNFFDEGGYKVTLSDGTSKDWGKDGRHQLQNQGQNIDGRNTRFAHDVDFSRSDSGNQVGWLNPLGYLMGQGGGQSGAFTGYGVNTIQQAADPRRAAQELYSKAGLDYGNARHNVLGLYEQGRIDAGKRDAFFNGLDELYQQGAYARR